MQDPNPKPFKTRKPWYQRAIEMSTLGKVILKTPINNTNHSTNLLCKTITTTTTTTTRETETLESSSNPSKQKRLKKSNSLKVATITLTRVCLCAPISSYSEIFNVDNNNNNNNVPPRRSYSYPRSRLKPFTPLPPQPAAIAHDTRVHSGRHSTEGGRRIFRGKSVTDNVLMRRFVVEEEAMVQVRRRNEMSIIRRRAAIRRKKIGPSPLSRMLLAQHA